MKSINYQISLENRNLKQINKTDISVIHTIDHFQSTVKMLRKALFNTRRKTSSVKNHKTLKAIEAY